MRDIVITAAVASLFICGNLQAQNTEAAMNAAWAKAETAKDAAVAIHGDYMSVKAQIHAMLFERPTNKLSQEDREDIWCQVDSIASEFEEASDYDEADLFHTYCRTTMGAASTNGVPTFQFCVELCEIVEDMWDEHKALIEEFICRLEPLRIAAQANL